MARIALFGGHGRVALHLERLLADDGHETSAFIRNPDHADDVRAAGGTPVVADVEQLDITALTELLQGHDAVVWSAGAGGGNPARTYAVDRDAAIASMTAAREAGVRRYVMVSYFGARPDHGVPEDNSFFAYAEAKSAADAHLRGTDLEWTILGPSASLWILRPDGSRSPVRARATRGRCRAPMLPPSSRRCSSVPRLRVAPSNSITAISRSRGARRARIAFGTSKSTRETAECHLHPIGLYEGGIRLFCSGDQACGASSSTRTGDVSEAAAMASSNCR